MSKFDDGGPALPMPYLTDEHSTLWDYYAAAALQGLLASNADFEKPAGLSVAEIISKSAGAAADALLAERRKRFQGDSE